MLFFVKTRSPIVRRGGSDTEFICDTLFKYHNAVLDPKAPSLAREGI